MKLRWRKSGGSLSNTETADAQRRNVLKKAKTKAGKQEYGEGKGVRRRKESWVVLPGYCAAPVLETEDRWGEQRGGGKKQKGWLAFKVPLKVNCPPLLWAPVHACTEKEKAK